MRLLLITLIAGMSLVSTSGVVAAESGVVYVNEVAIPDGQLQVLQYAYGPIQGGAYWYDPISGLWGVQGGPAQGQIDPGLPIGGPLRANASHGQTGVFINGRQLHPVDVDRLRAIFGVVPQGYYWMTADGIGGPQGGPATFNLGAASRGGSRSSGGQLGQHRPWPLRHIRQRWLLLLRLGGGRRRYGSGLLVHHAR